MGSIKNTAIKRLAGELIRQHADKFSEEFEHNKTALASTVRIESKKVRNILAGYISKEMERINKSGL
jgi:small subunit ribosomal protein S17e